MAKLGMKVQNGTHVRFNGGTSWRVLIKTTGRHAVCGCSVVDRLVPVTSSFHRSIRKSD